MNARVLGLLVVSSLMAVACASRPLDVHELTPKGPSAEQLYFEKSYATNGRAPTFGEKRRWEAEVEERVYKYLREHPELEQTSRYSDFRFWWQVTAGSTQEEVRVLLENPSEQTIDPVLMAAMAGRQWDSIQDKAKEAWFYAPAWVIYFDDNTVVAIVHKVSSITPTQE